MAQRTPDARGTTSAATARRAPGRRDDARPGAATHRRRHRRRRWIRPAGTSSRIPRRHHHRRPSGRRSSRSRRLRRRRRTPSRSPDGATSARAPRQADAILASWARRCARAARHGWTRAWCWPSATSCSHGSRAGRWERSIARSIARRVTRWRSSGSTISPRLLALRSKPGCFPSYRTRGSSVSSTMSRIRPDAFS